MSVRENLIAAKALIDTPEKWGKGLDSFTSKDGCPMCAHGALLRLERACGLTGEEEIQCRVALAAALPDGWSKEYDEASDVPSFNDHPSTTHADVMALFDRAIAAAEVSP